MIKRIVGDGKKEMQLRDGPEEEKKEFPIRKSSVMPILKSMPIPVLASAEVMMERDRNGKNGHMAMKVKES